MKRAVLGAVITTALGLAIMPLFPERTAANMLIPAIAGLAWVLTLLYGLRSQWSATRAGRATMYLSVTLAAFATQLSISVWVGSNYPGRNEIRFVLYFGLAVTIAHLIWIVLRAQREDRR